MLMLNNYGIKKTPKDMASEVTIAKAILSAAKKVCLRYTVCSRICPYHREGIHNCVLQSTNVRRPDVWDLPWEQDPLSEQSLLSEIVPEPEAPLVLSSIRNLSWLEKEEYRIWRC